MKSSNGNSVVDKLARPVQRKEKNYDKCNGEIGFR